MNKFKEYNKNVNDINFPIADYISRVYGKTITETMNAISDGKILVTDNATMFSRFAYFNQVEDSGLKPMTSVSNAEKFLFLEFMILPKKDGYYRVRHGNTTTYFYIGENE